jgi:hypothetical protein
MDPWFCLFSPVRPVLRASLLGVVGMLKLFLALSPAEVSSNDDLLRSPQLSNQEANEG